MFPSCHISPNNAQGNRGIAIIIIITRPWPAFGRLGLGGSSGVKTMGKGKISKNVTHTQTDTHTLHHYIYITIIIITRPWPAFGRLGLGGSSRGYSSHGKTFHASLRACCAQCGAQLEGK